ncbi:MAG: hypothetical protein U5L96_10685 [Owenweeksia sp.]|nr:hypothetical protein [Owenweeksia sp.]
MLLDINMPVMKGWQLLYELSQANWREKLVVFMLSSSIAQYDMNKAKEYDLVAGYHVKAFSQASCLHLERHPELGGMLDA